jgi:hypothetical protein
VACETSCDSVNKVPWGDTSLASQLSALGVLHHQQDGLGTVDTIPCATGHLFPFTSCLFIIVGALVSLASLQCKTLSRARCGRAERYGDN